KVRNNLDSESKSTDFDTSGNYAIGDDTKVIVGDNPPRDERTEVKINSNRNSTDRDAEHMIRVIEGGHAFITAGEIRPYEHRTIIRHRYGVSVYDNVNYQDVTSGFYVTPRLIGNNKVSLHLQPHYRSANEEHSGTIDVQEADTTVEAYLGEWIQIGGIDTDANSKDNGILSTSHSSNNKRNEIYLKVDLE
ncbi:MAG: hypothetical protein P8X88_03225, partial [Gammaproteobacteria bacterium]